MPRVITPTIELGLGGSFIAQALGTASTYKFWAMKAYNGDLSVAQQMSVGTPPTGWSSGDTLTLFGAPLVHQPSDLPDGGSAVRLNGTSQYMQSVYDETAAPGDIGPQSMEIVLTVHALPGVGVEPAIIGGSTEFALTLKSDGRVYGYYNGSAVVDLPITVNIPTHIVLTRSDASPDSIKLYVNNVLDSATPANGAINRGFVHIGKHWTNAHYLDATVSFAAFYATEMSAAQVLTHYSAMVWTDVTNDYRIGVPIVIERGIKDDAPVARVAATGTCSFALDNSQKNSAGLKGYYTPGHVNCRAGFAMGIPCRVTMTVASVEYTQFVGRIRRIAPTANERGDRLTSITATDWMDEAARYRLVGASILEDVRADQVATAILDRMPNQPFGRTMYAGSETYELALDNTTDENTTALAEFVRLQHSEVGRAYISRAGSFVWESRYTRPFFSSDVLADIDTRMIALEAAEITDASVNRVQVTVHPRRVDDDPSTVLFSLDHPIAVVPGEPQTITGTYVVVSAEGQSAERVGGLDMQPPTYAAFEFDDGSGANNTADLGVTTRFDANTVTFTLTNNRTTANPTSGSTTIHVTSLSVSGRGIYDFQPIVSVAEDAEAIAANGVNAVAFDMGYQQDARVGQHIATALLAAYQQQGVRARTVTVNANRDELPADLLERDVSDRVALTEYMTAIDAEYHINGVKVEFSSGVKCDVTWWLATPAEGDALMSWQDVAFAAGNFTQTGGTAWTVIAGNQLTYAYSRKSNEIAIAFEIISTNVSGSPGTLRIAIPGGYLALRQVTNPIRVSNAGGAVVVGVAQVTPGSGVVALYSTIGGSGWTATAGSNTSVQGEIIFPIQT